MPRTLMLKQPQLRRHMMAACHSVDTIRLIDLPVHIQQQMLHPRIPILWNQADDAAQ